MNELFEQASVVGNIRLPKHHIFRILVVLCKKRSNLHRYGKELSKWKFDKRKGSRIGGNHIAEIKSTRSPRILLSTEILRRISFCISKKIAWLNIRYLLGDLEWTCMLELSCRGTEVCMIWSSVEEGYFKKVRIIAIHMMVQNRL